MAKGKTAHVPDEPEALLEDSAAHFVRQRQSRQRIAALNFTLAAVFFLSAILSVIFAREIAETLLNNGYRGEYLENNTASVRLFALLFVIGGAGAVTYLYATGFSLAQLRRAGEELNASAFDLRTLADTVDKIRVSADELRKNRFVTAGDKKIIARELEGIVRETLPRDFLNKIDQKYGGAIKNEKLSRYVEETSDTIKTRLQSFQSDLSHKASFSMAWGLSTAAGGIIVMLILIFYSQPPGSDFMGGLFYYTARIGLVAIIEIIAFFFLSQYRFTLWDEKYVNNEVTNVELQMTALVVAAKLGDKSALEKVLIALVRTERNFALKKGETSIFHPPLKADLLQSSTVAHLLRSWFGPDRSNHRSVQN